MTEDISAALGRLMARDTGLPGTVEGLARLSGGASMESSRFRYAGADYVLRRSPFAELGDDRQYGHDVEAAIVRAAAAAGVRAPEIVAEIGPDDGLGSGYVMRMVHAEVNPVKILAAPPASLLPDLAREAARIHSVPLATLPPLPTSTPGDVLGSVRDRFIEYGGDRPVIALALRWLEENLPEPSDPVLVHGDYRLGNVMVDADGLAVVLDWELAHLGDRHRDLAFGCINSWRFGHIDRPAFGCGDLLVFQAAYEAESGASVDLARFHWWLVYSTVWWGVCCLQMADIWRRGQDTSLERAVIGRRCSETEVDLLLLLQDEAPPQENGPIVLADSSEVRRSGEPSAVEMLEALAAWIRSAVKPKAQGREGFMAAVALNAIGMLTREGADPCVVHDAALAGDLLAGRKSLETPGLLAHLKEIALRKLALDQPKYSALAKARAEWLSN